MRRRYQLFLRLGAEAAAGRDPESGRGMKADRRSCIRGWLPRRMASRASAASRHVWPNAESVRARRFREARGGVGRQPTPTHVPTARTRARTCTRSQQRRRSQPHDLPGPPRQAYKLATTGLLRWRRRRRHLHQPCPLPPPAQGSCRGKGALGALRSPRATFARRGALGPAQYVSCLPRWFCGAMRSMRQARATWSGSLRPLASRSST